MNRKNEGKITQTSVLEEKLSVAPQVRVQRHFTFATDASGSGNVEINRPAHHTDGSSVMIPGFSVPDDEAGVKEMKKVKSFPKTKSKRPQPVKHMCMNGNHVKSTGIRESPKTTNKGRIVSRDKAKLALKQKKKIPKDEEIDPTLDLKFKLDSVGRQLAFIENSFTKKALEEVQNDIINSNGDRTELDELMSKLYSVNEQETNPAVEKDQFAKLYDAGNANKKLYNASDYMVDIRPKQYNSRDYMEPKSYMEKFMSVNENLFLSTFARDVTEKLNQPQEHSDVSPSLCESDREERLKQIREELKQWKEEYIRTYKRGKYQNIESLFQNLLRDTKDST